MAPFDGPTLIHHPGNGFDFKDVHSEYEARAMSWCEAAYEEASLDNAQTEEMKDFHRQIDYLMGKQWPAGRPTYKSKPVNNRIWRIFRELLAILTDIKPIFKVGTSNKQFEDQAKVLDILTRSWWMDADADLKLAQWIIYAMLTTGYVKIEWDPWRPRGADFDLKVLGPNDLLPLKPRDTLGSAQALIYQSIQPLNYFRKRYPVRGWMVPANPMYSNYRVPARIPPNVSPMTFQHLSPQMQQHLGNRSPQFMQSAFPMNIYREFWFEDASFNESNAIVTMGNPGGNWSYQVGPGQPLYPRGRLMCTGGRIVLYDGPNPYWHGQYPFAALRMNVVPWQWLGVSELRSWMTLQDIGNNILAGIMDMVKKAVNPVIIAPKNVVGDQAWKQTDMSMPGAKLAYNPYASHPPTIAPTPQIPPFVMQTLLMVNREMDQDSGIAAISEAVRKNQIPSGDTLDQIQQAKQTPLRLKSRYIEVGLRDLGVLAVPNFLQFYDLARRLRIAGEKGITTEDLDADKGTMVPGGHDAPGHGKNFFFSMQQGSLLNLDRDKKAALFMALRKQGDIDLKTLYEKLEVDVDIDQVIARLKQEFTEKAQMAQAAGAGQPQRRRR